MMPKVGHIHQTVTVRMTYKEFQETKNQAHKHKMSMNEYVRQTLDARYGFEGAQAKAIEEGKQDERDAYEGREAIRREQEGSS